MEGYVMATNPKNRYSSMYQYNTMSTVLCIQYTDTLDSTSIIIGES